MDIRVLDAGAIPAALLLSAEAGWNQTADDWGAFITHGTVLGAFSSDSLVATSAVLPYGTVGWVSMVLVTANFRGRGIATHLVRRCIDFLQDAGCTPFLDATDAGVEVYAKLGFQRLCGLQRWAGVGGGRALPERLQPDFRLDCDRFGAERTGLLQEVLTRPGSLAIVIPDGFGLLRLGAGAMQVGPLVAAPAAAVIVLEHAIAAARGRVVVDVLAAADIVLSPLLRAHGFTVQRAFTRMALGRTTLPGDPLKYPVAMGPEFG